MADPGPDSDESYPNIDDYEEMLEECRRLEPKEIPPHHFQGDFSIYDVSTLSENVKLDGNYGIKLIKSEENYEDVPWNINTQAPFRLGRVFYRNDTEDIFDLISMFSDYSYKDLDNVEKCTAEPAVPERIQGGTICPTKKELFIYKDKKFIAFGRYIHGFQANFVTIIRNGVDHKSIRKREYVRCYFERVSEIANDWAILSVPFQDDVMWENEYVYSFMIFDTKTGILDAFGLYR